MQGAFNGSGYVYDVSFNNYNSGGDKFLQSRVSVANTSRKHSWTTEQY